MMKKLFVWVLAGIVLALGSQPLLAVNEREDKYDRPIKYAVKEQEGLRFDVPEDWPIEKRGGVVAPIPVDEYLVIKFKEVDKKIEALSDEIESFGARVDVLEKKNTKPLPVFKTEEKA